MTAFNQNSARIFFQENHMEWLAAYATLNPVGYSDFYKRNIRGHPSFYYVLLPKLQKVVFYMKMNKLLIMV